jgi:signal peptidase
MTSTTQHRRPPRRTARRVGAVVVNVLLLVATVAGLAYLAPSLLGYERYVITGGSMTGTIDKGSVVFEKNVPVADLAVGDVITYLPPADSGVTNLVTHRIIRIGTSETGARLFRTQGDANPEPDPWSFSLTAPDQPVVRHHVPHVGWVLIALADRDVRVLAVGIPAGIVALLSAVELVGALREGRRGRRPGDGVDDLVPAPVALPTAGGSAAASPPSPHSAAVPVAATAPARS